jgi:hypothetical protein
MDCRLPKKKPTLAKKTMRSLTLFTFILFSFHSVCLNAQTRIEASADEWTTYNSTATFDDGTIHIINVSDKTALLWLNETNLKNGVVELDIKGKGADGQSFLGIAFHGLNNERYDAVYFRPFNFKNPEKKDRAVQYIDRPDNDWNILREKHPGKYEHAVRPVPDPDDWFHAKIVIDFPAIKVYVNGAKEPSLDIEQISKRQEGKFGLWVDSEDGWFRNILITHSDQ